ncbi:MAG: LacI family DNA-binding transcriptional regulator [Aggregatilineales bacterium]
MKKRSSVTQKQIAERAGVSQTVVSLALNNSYEIALNDETRQRVVDVATELGYVPQAAAKALVRGHSSNIGLILIQPHYQVFRDPFIPNIITGISGVVRAHDYRLLVEHIDNVNQLHTIPNMLRGGEVDGLVLSTFDTLESIIEPLTKDGYPIIFLDKPAKGHYAVTIDHEFGVRLAASHLLACGHQDVGVIPFSPATPHTLRRLDAFKDAFASAGCPIPEDRVRFGNYDPESGYEAMKTLLQIRPLPSAVFGMNDLMAIGAMRAIHEAGLSIPQDIAVIGYDDMRFAPFTRPTLTTIRAPEVEQGQVAGDALIKRIAGEALAERQISLKPQLIIRESCQ